MNTHMKPQLFGQFNGPQIEFFRDAPARTSIFSRLWTSLLRAREQRRARAALRSFDDRMLRDIGISRSEIEQIVRYGEGWGRGD